MWCALTCFPSNAECKCIFEIQVLPYFIQIRSTLHTTEQHSKTTPKKPKSHNPFSYCYFNIFYFTTLTSTSFWDCSHTKVPWIVWKKQKNEFAALDRGCQYHQSDLTFVTQYNLRMVSRLATGRLSLMLSLHCILKVIVPHILPYPQKGTKDGSDLTCS